MVRPSALPVLALLPVALACNRTPDSAHDRTLTYDIVPLATPAFDRIRDMKVSGTGQLVILDRSAPHLTIFDPARNRIISRLGTTGDGPGELRSPHYLDWVGGSRSTVWVLQANRRRFTRFDLVDSSTQDLTFTTPEALDGAAMLPQGMIAIGTFTDSGAIHQGDSSFNGPLRQLGRAPYRPEDLPPVPIFDANRASFSVNPARSVLAVGYRYAPYVQVVDTSGHLIANWSRPNGVGEPRISFPGSQLPTFSSDSSIVAYTHIASWDGGVFAAYCGCIGSSLSEHDSLTIDIFAIGRGYVGSIKAPAPLRAMAASHDGSRLFVAADRPEPVVLSITVRGNPESRR
jgi:hypothetical protein